MIKVLMFCFDKFPYKVNHVNIDLENIEIIYSNQYVECDYMVVKYFGDFFEIENFDVENYSNYPKLILYGCNPKDELINKDKIFASVVYAHQLEELLKELDTLEKCSKYLDEDGIEEELEKIIYEKSHDLSYPYKKIRDEFYQLFLELEALNYLVDEIVNEDYPLPMLLWLVKEADCGLFDQENNIHIDYYHKPDGYSVRHYDEDNEMIKDEHFDSYKEVIQLYNDHKWDTIVWTEDGFEFEFVTDILNKLYEL